MVATKLQILEQMQENHEYLMNLLKDRNDNFNLQVYKTKKTVAEIVAHILLIEKLPKRIMRPVYAVLGASTKSSKRPINGEDYVWNINSGKQRKPKSFDLEELNTKVLEHLNKFESMFEHKELSISDRIYYHHLIRHTSTHITQIKLLISKINA